MNFREVLRTLIAFETVSDRSNPALVNWVSNYIDGHGARVPLTRDKTGAGGDRALGSLLIRKIPLEAERRCLRCAGNP